VFIFKTALFACSHLIAIKVHGVKKQRHMSPYCLQQACGVHVAILQLRSLIRFKLSSLCSCANCEEDKTTLEMFENGKLRERVAGALEINTAKSLMVRSAGKMLFGQSNES
jgi:hypothetical protein